MGRQARAGDSLCTAQCVIMTKRTSGYESLLFIEIKTFEIGSQPCEITSLVQHVSQLDPVGLRPA
jgi:hypothetical protein